MNPVPLTQHPSVEQDPGCASPCIPQLFAHRLLPQAPVWSRLCEESMGWDPARGDHLKMTNPALQQIIKFLREIGRDNQEVCFDQTVQI